MVSTISFLPNDVHVYTNTFLLAEYITHLQIVEFIGT